MLLMPRAFRRAPVTADAPPGARARPDHTMWDAAFMSFDVHGRGIHAV